MPLQSTVGAVLASGVVGELYLEGPRRAAPGVLKGTAVNMVIGRAFTIDPADGAYSPGGTNPFGGILANPKAAASYGTAAGGGLASTLTLPVGAVGEFVTDTPGIWVQLTNAANIGQPVYYVNADGTLAAGTAGAGQTQIPGARVERFTNAAPGLACISLNGN